VDSYVTAATAAPCARGSRGGFRLGLTTAVIACLAILLAVWAPSALAAPKAEPGYGFIHGFGAGTAEPSFSNGNQTPLAVDSNGLIFYIGGGFSTQGKVFVFAPDPVEGGVQVTQVSASGQNVQDIAVDRVDNSLYVEDSQFSQSVRRFLSNGANPPTYTLDPTFSVPASAGGGGTGIAVDPTTRDLLVEDANTESIKRYSRAGAELAPIPLPFVPGPFSLVADGSVYMARPESSDIVHLSAAGATLGEFDVGGEAKSIAVDPNDGSIVVLVDGVLRYYTAAGVFQSETPGHGSSKGLALDPANSRLYAWTGNMFEPGEINAFVRGIVPGVEPPTVSITTPDSVHVDVEVDPGAGPPAGSSVKIEYSTDGGTTWAQTAPRPVAAAETVGVDVDLLEPAREYLFRAQAFNSVALNTSGATQLNLPAVAPLVKTGSATDVSETSAVLNGSINPASLPTRYWFEYGTTPGYGFRVPVGIDGAAGNARVYNPYNRVIKDLAPGTTYHFRLVATNALGTTDGADRTFTTASPGAIPARAYEEVTPAEKNGAAVIPGLGFQASPSGDGFSYVTKTGANSSPMVARSIAVRGAEDWSGKIDTDPPLNVGVGGFLVYPTLAVSDDFTKALVVSNRALTPGSLEFGCNIYIADLRTGTYRLIAKTDAPNAFNEYVGSKAAGTYLAGAPDLSWVIFDSPSSLLPGAPKGAYYRWSETGGLEVISILPDGEMSAAMRSTSAQVYKPVSADGSQIYFTAYGGSEEGVFLRQNGVTRVVSASHISGGPSGPQPALLLGTNAGGRYAFIASSTPLTADAPGMEDDLYRYDSLDGSLRYLGAQAFTQAGASPTGPTIELGSYGISANGDTIYFNTEPSPGSLGEFSVWRNGVVHAVTPAPLGIGNEHPSPNGRYFVLLATVEGVSSVVEVYDADKNELTCVSCLPDGTPVSGRLPEAAELYVSDRFPQTVDDSGNVYFDTEGRLVAADVNGTRDVYVSHEGAPRLISPGNRPFEATYSDMSEDGSDVFFTTAQKLVGRDNDESIDVYDARVNGGLPAQSPPPPNACLRDDCKAVPNAGPELPFGGSEQLSGPGDVKPPKKPTCGKGKHRVKVKGKAKCVKKKPKSAKHQKKKKAATSTKQRADQNKKGGNR
jgi:hypothetical protein